MFGPDFERYEQIQAELAHAEAEKEKQEAPEDKTKAKKGKLVAKSTGLTYQFQIMESIGILRSEIKNFADPSYWLTYFPPIAIVGISLYSMLPFSNHSKERPQRIWFSYRLASIVPHHQSQPVLWCFCSMAGEQVIQTGQNQVWRAIHYLQSKRWPTLYGPRSARRRRLWTSRIHRYKDGSSWMESSGENIDRWKGWGPESLFSRRYSTSRDNVQSPQLLSLMH